MTNFSDRVYFINNVTVNWFRDVLTGLNVSRYSEWRSEDLFEFIPDLVFLRVSKDVMDLFEDSVFRLPVSILRSTYGKSTLRELSVVDTIGKRSVFGVTDGTRVMVVDTDGTEYTVYKSRVSYELEDIILSESGNWKEFVVGKIDAGSVTREPYGLEWYMGLTRLERSLKDVFLYELEGLRDSGTLEELMFYVTEFNPGGYSKYCGFNREELWSELERLSRRGLGEYHYRVVRVIHRMRGFRKKSLDVL